MTAGSTQTTNYFVGGDSMGLPYERINKAGSITHRYFVSMGGRSLAQIDVGQGNDPAQTVTDLQKENRRYFLTDHLDSIAVSFAHHYSSANAVADEVKVERQFYDPWGRQRKADGNLVAEFGPAPFKNNRGFTGHEHLNGVGLIHMNGRVYDPHLGRFASVDPIVSDAMDLQAYNRYSYVGNRPLMYSDPSGYSWLNPLGSSSPLSKVDEFIGSTVLGDTPLSVRMRQWGNKLSNSDQPHLSHLGNFMVWFDNQQIRLAYNHPEAYGYLSSAVIMACGYGAPACAAGIADFQTALRTTDNVAVYTAAGKAARKTGGTQALFYGAGQAAQGVGYATGTDMSAAGSYAWQAKVAFHMAAGCIAARMNDGSCGKGALSSGVTAAATSSVTEAFGDNHFAQGAALAMLGGVTSVIAGDKFQNGAVMALYGYLYNQLLQQDISRQVSLDQAKVDAGIPRSASPTSVTYEKLYDGNNGERPIVDKNGKPVEGRVYNYDTPKGTVKIQEHSAGHMFRDASGKWVLQEGGHFNVRDGATGKPLSGVRDHYYFNSRVNPQSYYWRSGGAIVPRGSQD